MGLNGQWKKSREPRAVTIPPPEIPLGHRFPVLSTGIGRLPLATTTARAPSPGWRRWKIPCRTQSVLPRAPRFCPLPTRWRVLDHARSIFTFSLRRREIFSERLRRTLMIVPDVGLPLQGINDIVSPVIMVSGGVSASMAEEFHTCPPHTKLCLRQEGRFHKEEDDERVPRRTDLLRGTPCLGVSLCNFFSETETSPKNR